MTLATSPTTLTELIPAYLYRQYADDDDLQAFFREFNDYAQGYVDWFADTALGVYTELSGELLDWCVQGIYGLARPPLSSGSSHFIGPYNTYLFDQLTFNGVAIVSSSTVFATSDDVYKRIVTWNFYKGDGRVFNTRWLKRRMVRFLTGINGADDAAATANTGQISVVFAGAGVVNVVIHNTPVNYGATALALQEAMDTGAVQLPFQFTFNVTVS